MERSLQHDSNVRISIAGFQRGSRAVHVEAHARDIPALGDEFQGELILDGSLRRVGNRIYVDVTVTSPATLQCDRSLEWYSDLVERHLELVYEINADLASEQRHADVSDVPIRGLSPDRQWIDLTDDVRQELMLGLPMKRVAPQYRDRELNEIYPALNDADNSRSSQTEDQWAALRTLRGNQS